MHIKENLPYLFDDTSNAIVGHKNPDGTERLWASTSMLLEDLLALDAKKFKGCTVWVSDWGAGGSGMLLVSNGANWKAMGRQTVARSFIAATTPADTTEDVLATIDIPTPLLAANGLFEVQTFWSFTSYGNNKTLRARFDGASGTAVLSTVVTTGGVMSTRTVICNRNSSSSQYVQSNTGTGAVSATTTAVEDSEFTQIVITGQKATSGDSLVLEGYIVEMLP